MDKEKLLRLLASGDDDTGENLMELLRVLGESESAKPIDVEKHSERLRSLGAEYNRTVAFREGDLVKWKPGLKNKKRPQYGEPCIVVEVLEIPITDEKAPVASPYFGEKLDLKLGLLDRDNEFMVFHFDRNRFEHFARPDADQV
jgi:hypothetical protein